MGVHIASAAQTAAVAAVVITAMVVSVAVTASLGQVVKASASRAEDPGFESRLPPEFYRSRVIPVT